ncbi:hypothetical protein B0O80DRAFT_498264 [Mortierella sp. GBAus27b]|nr:hypothetical protein B0O80DRAFT_498264 [Mortierella sp. GBAus27b]
MSNGRIQALKFMVSSDLSQRITSGSITMSPRLRTLRLHSHLSADAKPSKTLLDRIIAKCPNLAIFGLGPWRYQDEFREVGLNEHVVEILQQNPKLSEIRVGYWFWSLSRTLDAVVSARHEMMKAGKAVGLRKLSFVNNLDDDNLPPTSITVDFSQSNTATDFAIIIKNLQWESGQKSNMEEFFGTYGWAITELDVTSSDFTKLSVGGGGGRTTMEWMEKVIGDAQDLEQLWIQYTPFENEMNYHLMKGFFSRQGSKVTGLSMKRRGDWYLTDGYEDVLPLRTSLPRLTDLQIWAEISSTQWLAEMEWTRVIEAMDFSTLEECEISSSNFSVDQFELFVWCMGRTGTPIPLQLLNVSGTKLHKGEDGERLQWTLDAFSKKVPRAIVMGIKDAPSR